MSAGEISSPWMRVAEKILIEGEQNFDKEPIYEILNEEVKIKGTLVNEVFCIDEDYFLASKCDSSMINWMRKNFFDSTPVLDWGYSYGSRIGNKIELVIEKLKKNPQTKSATIGLMDAKKDYAHVPCVTTLDFKIRQKALYFNIQMRSQDIGKKAFADYVCFVDIARKVCVALDLTQYVISVWINSAHIYQTDYKRIESLTERYFGTGKRYDTQAKKWSTLAKEGEWENILTDKKSYANLDKAYGEFEEILKTKSKDLKKTAKVLDLGCGTCTLFKVFKLNKKNLYGTDIAQGMIEKAREKFPSSNLSVCDVLEYNPKTSFNLIYSRGVLANHLGQKSWVKILDKYYDKLLPNGLFMFDFLNRSWTEKREDVHQPNKVLYTTNAILNLIKMTKFSTSKIEVINAERRSPIIIIMKGP